LAGVQTRGGSDFERPDELFDRLVETVDHELTALQAQMEVDCPL
jgi:hypothetical protein